MRLQYLLQGMQQLYPLSVPPPQPSGRANIIHRCRPNCFRVSPLNICGRAKGTSDSRRHDFCCCEGIRDPTQQVEEKMSKFSAYEYRTQPGFDQSKFEGANQPFR